MQHVKAILETWNAFMTQCLLIKLDDAHDKKFNCFSTSKMLQQIQTNDGSNDRREKQVKLGSCDNYAGSKQTWSCRVCGATLLHK